MAFARITLRFNPEAGDFPPLTVKPIGVALIQAAQQFFRGRDMTFQFMPEPYSVGATMPSAFLEIECDHQDLPPPAGPTPYTRLRATFVTIIKDIAALDLTDNPGPLVWVKPIYPGSVWQ